jgi:hypothetical protein
MRRIAILLVPAVATLGAVAGSVMSAAPASADSNGLIQATVQVLPSPVNSLASVCISSQSLHPDPACLVIP